MVLRAKRLGRAASLAAWILLLGLGRHFEVHLWAGERGGKAEYVGGTVAELQGKTSGVILTTDPQALVFQAKKVRVHVPWERIKLLEYGQKVDRRYAMGVLISPILLLSKKRRHFLTVHYTDEGGQQHAMVFRIDKNDVRSVLASLEAKSGRRVEFQDEEARKAGKG
ncbi:MAG: hypothetical protein ACE141_19350 [Bryobacteraceae bacterium]